ncbi:MAG: DUF2058 family protein [Thiotrichaceae bacterium]
MANSLRDQLFQAGLVTEEQVTKAEKPKKKKPRTQKKTNPRRKANVKNKKNSKAPQSDLAQFYQQRTHEERKEKQQEEKQRQEAAQLKKERRQKIGKLIKENALKEDEGEIRYNFVIGTSIKYLFVTEQQQQQLSEGILAITFLGGKKRLIPTETGKQILEIDPEKTVILSE